jgi:hypothetical protein
MTKIDEFFTDLTQKIAQKANRNDLDELGVKKAEKSVIEGLVGRVKRIEKVIEGITGIEEDSAFSNSHYTFRR